MIIRFGRVVCVAAALMLPGCALTEGMQTALFDTTKVNLTDSTYAAADMLAQQTRAHMNPSTPLRTMVITDVNYPNEATAFGTQVANQLGSRFVQLGYNVQALPSSPTMSAPMMNSGLSGSPVALTPDGAMHPTTNPASKSMANTTKGGTCIVSGNYTRMKNTLLVSLRIVQTTDQRVIAAYDYTLPLTPEMNELSMSAAQKQSKAAEPAMPIFGNK